MSDLFEQIKVNQLKKTCLRTFWQRAPLRFAESIKPWITWVPFNGCPYHYSYCTDPLFDPDPVSNPGS